MLVTMSHEVCLTSRFTGADHNVSCAFLSPFRPPRDLDVRRKTTGIPMIQCNEKDWKILRESIDSYCDRIYIKALEDISIIINNAAVSNGDKIFMIARQTKAIGKEIDNALCRISRTRFIEILLYFVNKGAIGDDLEKYSDQVRNLVKLFIEQQA